MNQRTSLFLTAALAAIVSIGATGCGRQCKQTREEIIQPARAVETYLNANPSGEELAQNGCELILTQFQKLPHGAKVIRRIAETRFSHSVSHCQRWETSYRHHCYKRPYPQPPNCYSQPYTYCAQWEYDVVREPGYARAVELSRDVDSLFEKSHAMCGKAGAGDVAGAYALSRELSEFLSGEVKPEGEKVYAMACGS